MIRAAYVREEDENYEAVVLEDDDGSLSIQRALVFDEQDRASGMDTYCLVADGEASHYGGVEEWSAGRGHVQLVLTGPAAAALGLPTAWDLEFDPENLREIDPIVLRLISGGLVGGASIVDR